MELAIIRYFVIYESPIGKKPTDLKALGFKTKKNAMEWLVEFKYGIGKYYLSKTINPRVKIV